MKLKQLLILTALFVAANVLGSTLNTDKKKQEFFNESFGKFNENDRKFAKVNKHKVYDMQAPVAYSSEGNKLSLERVPRFPENDFFIMFAKDASDQSLLISNINSDGYKNLELTFDFAVGDVTMLLNQLTLKCNGEVVELEAIKAKNRDRFESVSVVIPNGTNTIEFVIEGSASTYFRLDNVRIVGEK